MNERPARVKRLLRLPPDADAKLRDLATKWGLRGPSEVIPMLLAMYEDERPKQRKRS